MKKVVSAVMACILAASSSAVVFAEDEAGDTIAENYASGALEMTAEEIELLEQAIPKIVDVKPNRLFQDRLNEELGIEDGGDISGGGYGLVADGEEIITNRDNIPMTLAASDTTYPSQVDNSKLNESTVDDTIITVTDSEDNYIGIDLALSSSEDKVYLSKWNGEYESGFYTINISPQLKSKGGNGLPETLFKPFYVPFH